MIAGPPRTGIRCCPPMPLAGVGESLQKYFHESPYPALREVRCTFSDGIARLDGALPSFYLKQLAQEIVKQHEVVREVHNHISVEEAHQC